MLTLTSWTVFVTILVVVSSQSTRYCRLEGDPHITEFHDPGRSYPRYKDCLSPGPLVVVSNQFLTLTMQVQTLVMIELQFVFRNQPNTPAFCTISSFNYQITVPQTCIPGGVFADVTNNRGLYVLSVNYPAQNMRVTLTHQTNWARPYYNMYVWMDSATIANSIGVCSVAGCSGYPGRKRSVRSAQNVINNMTAVSNTTARQICDTYIDSYLNSLPRIPAQRDAHYNSSIEYIREMCIYDVTTLGPGYAPGYLSSLLIEEITTGLTNISAIDTAISTQMAQAAANLDQNLNRSIQMVARILNITDPQTITSTTQTSTPTGTTVTTTPTTSVSSTTTGLNQMTSQSSAGEQIQPLMFYLLGLIIYSSFKSMNI